MVPYVVVEASPEAFELAVAEVRASGWRVIQGWHPPAGPHRIVCVGRVESAQDAAAALLAAVAGVGLVIEATAEREVVDRLCDDLRHFGPLDHRTTGPATLTRLDDDEYALLEMLLAGQTLGQAAAALHLSRRTADRRLASARSRLGVLTTAQALAAFGRRARGPGQ
jgi:DNA-binding NarL/FixJ family response regulator